MPDDNDVLTAQEAANFLRIDKKLLYKLIESGDIAAKRVGRIFRIHKDVLTNYIKGDSHE
jgi:excisionase family DNA binding protein